MIQSAGVPAWRSRVREIALACAYYSGLMWLIAHLRLRDRLVVLTYHRVLPPERLRDSFSSRGILVTPKTFDRQMEFLRRHLQPLTPEEFVRYLRSGKRPPRRSCLVTFDDGWHDMLEFALPILRRHDVPAVLFLPVDHVGSDQGFWQERLARLLHAHCDDSAILQILATTCPPPTPGPADLESIESILALVARLKSLPPAMIRDLIERIERSGKAPLPGGEDRFLDWTDVDSIVASGVVAIGSHAMSHRPFTHIPLEEVRAELLESVRVLHERIGTAPTLLAYPNGDATPEIAAVAASTGFEAAFTTERGLVSQKSDRHLLRRVNIHESATRTHGAFFGRLMGLV